MLTIGCTNTELLLAGFSLTTINNAKIFYRQPPPIITEIVTAPGKIYIYFLQPQNISKDITNYVYSLDGGKTVNMINTIKSPLVISDLKEGTYPSLHIGAYNNCMGALNCIYTTEAMPFSITTGLETAMKIWLNIPSIMISQPQPSEINNNSYNLTTTLINDITFIANFVSMVKNSDLEALCRTYITSPTAGTMEGVKATASTIASFAIGLATGNPASLMAKLTILMVTFTLLMASSPGALRLTKSNININYLDKTPVITNVTCINGTITIYFTKESEPGISVDNYAFSINDNPLELFYPKATTSPLIIPNSGVEPCQIHSISIAACDYKKTMYQSSYSMPYVLLGKTFSDPIDVKSYSNNSNKVSFKANVCNLPPFILGMTPVSTGTVDITFQQQQINSSNKITNYAWSADGKNFTLINPPSIISPLRITGLPNGTSDIRLYSYNGLISLRASNKINVSSNNVPAAPVINVTSDSYGNASITFTQINKDPNYVSKYVYSTNGGTTYNDFTLTKITSPIPISLTLGSTYSINMKSWNGIFSVPSNTVIITVGQSYPAPIITDLQAQNTKAYFTVSQPPSTQGYTVTNYAVVANNVNVTQTNIQKYNNNITVINLQNTSYSFSLKAQFSDGTFSAPTKTYFITISKYGTTRSQL